MIWPKSLYLAPLRLTWFSTSCKNSSWLQKMAECSLEKWADDLVIPLGKIFGQNRSILHHFWDKCILCFTQKFTMATKNDRKIIFGKKRQMKVYTLLVKICLKCSFLHHFRDKCVLEFYAELQDGHQKWRENDFFLSKSLYVALFRR